MRVHPGGQALVAVLGENVGGHRQDRRSKWRHYLGDDFALPGGRLRLTEVRAERVAGEACEQFSLVFSGAPADALSAGTHQLTHTTGQRIALFMQPAGRSAQGSALYRADFNLLG